MTFDREELLSVLNDASPAVARTAMLEGYKHFWFDNKNVYAYDGGLGIRLPLKTELDCGLPGKPLLELLKTSTLKEVFLDQVKDDVVLQMGKAKVTLVSLPGDIFFGEVVGEADKAGLWPFLLAGKPKGGTRVILSEAMVGAFNKLRFVRKSGGDQPMHHGITLVAQKDKMELYATDSRSLAQAVVEEEPPKGLERVIIPWGLVSCVLDLVEPGATLHIGDYLMVEGGDGVRLFSNLLEEQSEPDLAVLAGKYRKAARDRADLPPGLRPLLERVSILAGEEDANGDLSCKGNILTLSGKYRLGAVNGNITLNGKLPNAAARYNATVLMRGFGEANRFAMDATSIMLFGDEDRFMYIVAAVDGGAR